MFAFHSSSDSAVSSPSVCSSIVFSASSACVLVHFCLWHQQHPAFVSNLTLCSCYPAYVLDQQELADFSSSLVMSKDFRDKFQLNVNSTPSAHTFFSCTACPVHLSATHAWLKMIEVNCLCVLHKRSSHRHMAYAAPRRTSTRRIPSPSSSSFLGETTHCANPRAQQSGAFAEHTTLTLNGTGSSSCSSPRSCRCLVALRHVDPEKCPFVFLNKRCNDFRRC